MLTRTLYKVLAGASAAATLSAIHWHDDAREDQLKDLSWASGEYGDVGFRGDGDARCYLSADPDLDGVSVLDEDNGTSVEDDIAIAHRRWRGDRRRAAIRALEYDQRYDRMGWVQL